MYLFHCHRFYNYRNGFLYMVQFQHSHRGHTIRVTQSRPADPIAATYCRRLYHCNTSFQETSAANSSHVESVSHRFQDPPSKEPESPDKDDVFCDNEADSTDPTKTPESKQNTDDDTSGLARATTEKVSISGNKGSSQPVPGTFSKAEATENSAGSGINVSRSEN
ncbi:hypothetical protein Rs2_24606 [Raphanus sativus]|nr:hypothetical protein Rs2_24606 [Raphanus sativus]